MAGNYLIDPKTFRTGVVAFALQRVAIWTVRREILVTGTALAESGLRALHQEHGPALGFFQIEPVTHDDLVNRELAQPHNADLAFRIRALREFGDPLLDLELNAAYGAAICALRYLTVLEEIPDVADPAAPTDAELTALGDYWDRFYNRGGKARAQEFVVAWRLAFPAPAPQPGAA